jgi:hypothetical protein
METVSTTGFRPVPALYRRKGGPPVTWGSSDPLILLNLRHLFYLLFINNLDVIYTTVCPTLLN